MGGLFNWYVAYTLLHNPALRVYRKGYVQMLRQARSLGVHIPISDRQADIDVNEMMENIRKAKEQLANAGKKNTDGNKLTENVTEVNLDCDDSVDVTDAEKGTTGLLSGASEKDCDVKFRVSASKMPSLFKTEVTNICETEGKAKRKEDSNLFGMDAAALNFRM